MSKLIERKKQWKSERSIDAQLIFQFINVLIEHVKIDNAIEILEYNLDASKCMWDLSTQAQGNVKLAVLSTSKNDYNNSILFCQKSLPIAREAEDLVAQSAALDCLGKNYALLGEYENAMEFLKEALAIANMNGWCFFQASAFSSMGDVLVAQGGREQEAIEMYQQACGNLTETDSNLSEIDTEKSLLSTILCKLGELHKDIGAWDDAIEVLTQSISVVESVENGTYRGQFVGQANQVMGVTYLEQYHTDESLAESPEQRLEILHKAFSCSKRAVDRYQQDPAVLLDLAQEFYFLNDMTLAHDYLKKYLDKTLDLGPTMCQGCYQTSQEDAVMEKCSGCKASHYCSRAHQEQAWKRGRLCHKVMCPLLNRWRRLKKGKVTDDSSRTLFGNFFESIVGLAAK